MITWTIMHSYNIENVTSLYSWQNPTISVGQTANNTNKNTTFARQIMIASERSHFDSFSAYSFLVILRTRAATRHRTPSCCRWHQHLLRSRHCQGQPIASHEMALAIGRLPGSQTKFDPWAIPCTLTPRMRLPSCAGLRGSCLSNMTQNTTFARHIMIASDR